MGNNSAYDTLPKGLVDPREMKVGMRLGGEFPNGKRIDLRYLIADIEYNGKGCRYFGEVKKIKCWDIIEDTFVYFDPPYRPITDTASFTAYTENLFNDEEQIELAGFVDDMHKKGAKIVISNSDPKNSNTEDDFFDNIYSSHKIKRVEATRMINCNSEARGKIKELLISNF